MKELSSLTELRPEDRQRIDDLTNSKNFSGLLMAIVNGSTQVREAAYKAMYDIGIFDQEE